MKRLIIIMGIIIIGIIGFEKKIDYNNNEIYRNYNPRSEYEKQYPINDYVDSQLNSSSYFHRIIVEGMMDSETLKQISDPWTLIKKAVSYLFSNNYHINKLIASYQYQEPDLIQFRELPENQKTELHNYEYVGYDKTGKEVQGYASLYEPDGNYSIAISFLNEDWTVNRPKALLLADDSNAEKLAYDIIEETQKIYGSKLDPQTASIKYYNSTIEQIAGAISYHAVVTLYMDEIDADNEVIKHAATTDISLIDHDAFFVNRSY